MAVHAVGVLCVRKELVRIINETQIIMSAAEEGRADVINRALNRIQRITEGMKNLAVG